MARATREHRPLQYTTFGVVVRQEDSSIGLGADGKTYVKISLPSRKEKLRFESQVIGAHTKWMQYSEKTAPEIYRFFKEHGGPIADFYMTFFSPGTRAFCIVVEPYS